MFAQKHRLAIGADQLDFASTDLQQHGPIVFTTRTLQISYFKSEFLKSEFIF